MITSIITEENELIRSALKSALQESGAADVIGDYARADEMALDLSRLKPDVVIVGGIGSLAERCLACNDIRDVSPNTRILTVFEKYEDDELREIILSGASGCVLTGAGKAEIIRSVGILANGGFSFDSDALIRLVGRVPERRDDKPAALDGLTERQVAVLSMIARGSKNREIAQELHVSPSTIKSDIRRIKDKLTLDTRAQLGGYAERCGLLNTPIEPPD